MIELLIERIQDFSVLDENWDAYGALKISDQVISNAIKIIKKLKFSSISNVEISPKSNGTISINIEYPEQNKYFYIEIGNTKYSGFIDNLNYDACLSDPYMLNGEIESINFDEISKQLLFHKKDVFFL